MCGKTRLEDPPEGGPGSIFRDEVEYGANKLPFSSIVTHECEVRARWSGGMRTCRKSLLADTG